MDKLENLIYGGSSSHDMEKIVDRTLIDVLVALHMRKNETLSIITGLMGDDKDLIKYATKACAKTQIGSGPTVSKSPISACKLLPSNIVAIHLIGQAVRMEQDIRRELDMRHFAKGHKLLLAFTLINIERFLVHPVYGRNFDIQSVLHHLRFMVSGHWRLTLCDKCGNWNAEVFSGDEYEIADCPSCKLLARHRQRIKQKVLLEASDNYGSGPSFI